MNRAELFESVAMVLSTVLRDQPYPEELAAAREVVYGGAAQQGRAVYFREAEHFAARMKARVMESTRGCAAGVRASGGLGGARCLRLPHGVGGRDRAPSS